MVPVLGSKLLEFGLLCGSEHLHDGLAALLAVGNGLANLLNLLLCLPIHALCVLLCVRDARFFDLLLLWGRTRGPALWANLRFWQASSYSPLALSLPDYRGRRVGVVPSVQVWDGSSVSARVRP